MSNNIIGIDLGTTFSGLAVLNSIGKPEVVPNADGERITPSVVYFTEEDPNSVLVGRAALNARKGNPARAARWIKRSMGEKHYPESILGRQWSPAELCSFVLKKLKNDCSQQIGNIEDAVITVPAYFDEIRRKATMDAGKMAGLNVIALINEPTAAALFYAASKEVSGRIVVFDLGGGTFDVTVMEVCGQEVNVICSEGDSQLGGYDFDKKIFKIFDEAYKSEFGSSLTENPGDYAENEDRAEDAKKILSKRPSAKINLVAEVGRMAFEITRDRFEEAISPDIARIEMLVETALDEAKMKPADADQVLLVGGSTRIPLVRRRLEKIFSFPPTAAVNVDEAVALGAAIHAGLTLMEEEPSKVSSGVAAGLKDIRRTDVCNFSYGTLYLGTDEETNERKMQNDILIKKNTKLPCKVTKTYYTIQEGQIAIKARVTQGEGSNPDYVNKIAEGEMELPPNRPAGRPIEITYSYDTNMRMQCIFEDVESGRVLEMDIDTQSGGVSQENVNNKRSVLDHFQVE